MQNKEDYLFEFYGEDCPGCLHAQKLINKFELENNIKFKKYEVWNNLANDKVFDYYDCKRCDAVPFLYNKKTDKFICGEFTEDELRSLVFPN